MTRVLIIGAGGIAHRHVEHLRPIRDVQIAGICDVTRDRAEALARKTSVVAIFTDAVVALESSRPDVALILTPQGVREPLIDLCLARRVPFFVEKPPCDRLSTGRRIAEKIAEAGILHTVGFMHRWHEALNVVLAELAGETLSLLTLRYVAPFATAPVFDKYPDPYLVEKSGGLAGDQGIHYVDIARYISRSEVETIRATGVNRLLPRSARVTTVDSACWTLGMRNGVLVNHSHTWCGFDWDCRVELATDRSRIAVSMFGNSAAGILRGKDYRYDGRVSEFGLEHRGFLDAVEHRDMGRVRSPYPDALESFRVAAEINRAIYGQSAELDAS